MTGQRTGGRANMVDVTAEPSPEEVFAAMVGVRGWRSQDVRGNSAAAGDGPTYRDKDAHFCRARVS